LDLPPDEEINKREEKRGSLFGENFFGRAKLSTHEMANKARSFLGLPQKILESDIEESEMTSLGGNAKKNTHKKKNIHKKRQTHPINAKKIKRKSTIKRKKVNKKKYTKENR
jgi:hypothetical protein